MTADCLRPAPAVRVYDNPSAFRLLEQEWKALFRQHGGWNLFLSWEWFDSWWEAFGAGNHLRILALSSVDGLVGVVPMMIEPDGAGGQRLALVGSDRTTDYGDVLVSPEYSDELAERLADFVVDGFGHWERVEFRSLPSRSMLLSGFREAAQRRGLRSRLVQSNTCPVAHLTNSWESYLAGLSKSDRHELRRKIRRSQAPGVQSLRRLQTPEEVADGMESFLRLHRISRPDKAEFLDERTASFFRRVGTAFAAEGWMRLNFMQIDGRDVAATMAFTRGERVLLYNSGLDPEYRVHSVGIALHAADLQQAIGEGKEWYDFLRGNEPYKYDLGARDNPIYTLTLSPEGGDAGVEGDGRG